MDARCNNFNKETKYLVHSCDFHVAPLIHKIAIGSGVDGENVVVLFQDLRPFFAQFLDSFDQRLLLLGSPRCPEVVGLILIVGFCLVLHRVFQRGKHEEVKNNAYNLARQAKVTDNGTDATVETGVSAKGTYRNTPRSRLCHKHIDRK